MTNKSELLITIALVRLCASVGNAQAPFTELSPSIELVSVQPTKVLYDVGEPVIGQVVVKNVSQSPQTVMVRAWLEWQIDVRTEPKAITLTIDPEKTETVTFTWEKLVDQFGYAFKAEVMQANQVIARGEDYFQITDNYWKVALVATAAPDKNLAFVESLPEDYYNGFEVFAWAPDDFLEMTPAENSWYSGQARYSGVKEGMVNFPIAGEVYGLKDLIALGHRYGLKATTYAKNTGGGPTGFEAARRHPEIVGHSQGILQVRPDAETLAKWDDRTVRSLPLDWLWVGYNMNDPRVVEVGIKELADSADMFGWDGVRWDGNFSVRPEAYDLEGKLIEKLTSGEADARNAENMRWAKEYISKRHPKCVYGYNYIWVSVANNLSSNPRETIELCREGGLLMNECIRNAGCGNHPLHNWRRYAETLVDDTERIKRLGGYVGPILDLRGTDADSQYKSLFTCAGGAHPFYGHLWGPFMTRYSFYCWDPALHQVWPPEARVNVAGNVWWDKWVFERTLSPLRKQLVIHLINPPTADGVGEQKTLPPAQKDVRVMYYPTSQPGWRLERVTRLDVGKMSPEDMPLQVEQGIAQVTVPELALWNILVFDFVKSA